MKIKPLKELDDEQTFTCVWKYVIRCWELTKENQAIKMEVSILDKPKWRTIKVDKWKAMAETYGRYNLPGQEITGKQVKKEVWMIYKAVEMWFPGCDKSINLTPDNEEEIMYQYRSWNNEKRKTI